jgi:hypothetical protein
LMAKTKPAPNNKVIKPAKYGIKLDII